MLTRKLSNSTTGMLAGLLVGLVSQTAFATDVVVAYGDDVARQARSVEVDFQARMSEYAQSLSKHIRANVAKEMERIKAPRLRLVSVDERKQG